jgi:uncharacterized protein (TIGR02145 family)
LYNWYAVSTGKLCPAGWHIPDSTELQELIIYLGGRDVASGKMKVPGTQFWDPPNTGATNSSGFSGLPAGFRWADNGGFFQRGYRLFLWTSAIKYWNSKPLATYYLILAEFTSFHFRRDSPSDGFSVRCIKD